MDVHRPRSELYIYIRSIVSTEVIRLSNIRRTSLMPCLRMPVLTRRYKCNGTHYARPLNRTYNEWTSTLRNVSDDDIVR